MGNARRSELTAFLRQMRARLAPQDAGLPAVARRRRKPGLRIEEAAALAGVSLTWYSALERGTDVRVSAGMLERIGDALHLSRDERVLLGRLASPASAVRASAETDPLLKTIVDGFKIGPAFVTDRYWNVRVFNVLAGAIYGFGSADEPNLMARMLLEPDFRDLHEDWERIARQMVAVFHLSVGQVPNDERASALIGRLRRESREFPAWWDAFDVRRFDPTPAVLRHPTLGRLELTFASFVTSAARPDDEPLMIVLQPPLDKATSDRLEAFARVLALPSAAELQPR